MTLKSSSLLQTIVHEVEDLVDCLLLTDFPAAGREVDDLVDCRLLLSVFDLDGVG